MRYPERTPAEEEAFMALVVYEMECEHPERYRHPPSIPSSDPQEWRCGVCGTECIRVLNPPPSPPRTER